MPVRILALGAALCLAACSGGSGPMSGDSNTSDGGPDGRSKEPASDSATLGELRPDVVAARKNLAERLDVAEAAIEVVEHRNVTWSDGAIGCPEPGMFYTQALVPGVWIHLRVGGEDHVYHGARDGEPFYCPADRADPPPDSDPLA